MYSCFCLKESNYQMFLKNLEKRQSENATELTTSPQEYERVKPKPRLKTAVISWKTLKIVSYKKKGLFLKLKKITSKFLDNIVNIIDIVT